MFENPECEDCVLHKRARHRCLPSIGTQDAVLAIYLDAPNFLDDCRGRSFVSDNAEFVKYCLRRMSVLLDSVFMDYIVKCYPVPKLPGKKEDRMACVRACSQYRFAALQKLPHIKAIVGLGSLSCETFTLVKEVGKRAGADWIPISPIMKQHVERIWIGMSPGVLKEQPSEAGSIFRVIWMAAEEAGLKPEVNREMKPYDFQV